MPLSSDTWRSLFLGCSVLFVIGLTLDPVASKAESAEFAKKLAASTGRIEIEIEYPPDGSVVDASACGVFAAGRALVVSGSKPRVDIVIVIDTSLSTIQPSGADINRNGVVGSLNLGRIGPAIEHSSDSGDSILAAEVAAARFLLSGLDRRRSRVAVVTFAGDERGVARTRGETSRPGAAATIEGLTFDLDRIDNALSRVLAHEPFGNTDMAAGLDQATRELRGTRDPQGVAAEKIVVFFTDGQPTLPYGPAAERDNILAVLDAAERATKDKIRIHSFAVGPIALEGPVAVVEMAAITGGSFTPVPSPGDLIELIGEAPFTRLREVTLRNATTGAEAQPFRVAADGSWIGFVKLKAGTNQIEILARADGGANAARTLAVQVDPQMSPLSLPPKFVVQRKALLKICLDDQRRLRISLENERIQQIRKDLRLEIEQARARARRRAATQKRELELSIDTGGE